MVHGLTFVPLAAILVAFGPGIAGRVDAQILWDALDTHEWIAEPWGSPVTAEHVDFQGRRCLRAIVTGATADWALLRTKRFLAENWQPPITSVRADVYIINAGGNAGLNLEVRSFVGFDSIVATLESGVLPDNQWQTVTWTLPADPGLDEVGHLSLVINGIASLTPTVYIDALRLITSTGQEEPWDSMDDARSWYYAGNWKDWSGIDPKVGFPGIEPISSLDGSPASPTGSLYLEWSFADGQEPGSDLAAVGTMGNGTGLNADFSTVDRIHAWLRSSTPDVPFRVYFYDGDAESGFFTPCYLVQTADTWEEAAWIIPWPPGFDRADVDALFFVVSGFEFKEVQTGSVRFDHVTLFSQETPPAPAEVGRWLTAEPWPVTAIHASLLPTGQVLHYAYPGGGPGSRAFLWEPSSGLFDEVSMSTDIFCSGLSFLPDGKLYVSGGNDNACTFQGRFDNHTFDPFTRTWTPLDDMSVGRWYPTNVTLGDGRVLILSGRGRDCETTTVMEMYIPDVGLTVVPGGERLLPLYPRLHLLTDGRVAHVGPGPNCYTFDPQNRVWEFVDFSNAGWRGSGTSVLVPGQPDTVMIIGGQSDGVATHTCERIDFSSPAPQWQPTGALSIARAHANAVILPDRKIMLIGGGAEGLYCEPTNVPEMFDPDTETWTTLPRQAFGRMYHSTAMLLPDGRVLSAGQDSEQSGSWGEIYEPPYLFRGPRPIITGVPAQITYRDPFGIITPDASSATSVALIRLSAVTHSVNTEQRYVGLDFSVVAADQITATAPPDGNHAPPGYYMLFIVNDQGVPSVAKFVQLTSRCGDGVCDPVAEPCSCPADCGAPPASEEGSCLDGFDNDCDGLIDSADLDCFAFPNPLKLGPNPFGVAGGVNLNRVGAFKMPASAAGQEVTIRVTLANLYIDTSDDPTNGCPVRMGLPDLAPFNGQVRYLGPPSAFEDNAAATPRFIAAELQCDPHYRDWSPAALAVEFPEADTSTIYFYGAEVMPCSDYGAQQAAQACVEAGIEDCFSMSLEIRTALWGDVWPPFGLVSHTDIGKIVDAFKGIAFVEGDPPVGAPKKVRAMLRKNSAPLDSEISFTDIGKTVDAFKTIPYAEDGPTTCP